MYIYIYPVLGDGPHWKEKVAGYQPFCKKFWWTNIAYINNLYPCQVIRAILLEDSQGHFVGG